MDKYVRIALTTVELCAFIVFLYAYCHLLNAAHSFFAFSWAADLSAAFLSLLLIFLCFIIVRKMPFWIISTQEWIKNASLPLQDWAHSLSGASLSRAIIVVAALTLFLELALIRWQGSLFPAFALYKNFTLLACFCGLGIGYALAKKTHLLLPLSIPLLTMNILLLTILRYGSSAAVLFTLYVIPVHEESAVFGVQWSHADFLKGILVNIPVYLLLIATFLLNALTLLPIGQFCGYLMERGRPVTSYGCNLLGSLLGVATLFIFGWLWVGPIVWFSLSVLLLLWYLLPSSKARGLGLFTAIACVVAIAWPIDPLTQYIYSPYQLIERTNGPPQGLMHILASGSFYQKVYDLSYANTNRESIPALKKVVGYYELPFRTAGSVKHAAIVGAGTGNDAAAALRCGAENVEAIEIDPAILELGKMNHPEHPYDDSRVHSIVTDARTFFRHNQEHFDMIVYGQLDSHVLLSHGSNVRVDSFVYTREGLQEAFAHLEPGGLMSVSFNMMNPLLGLKIYTIMKSFPGAGAPRVIFTAKGHWQENYGATYMVRKGAEIQLPYGFMDAHDLTDATQRFADMPTQSLDLPTDDWPFFYMEMRTYPTSYLLALALVTMLSAFLMFNLLPVGSWRASLLPFFFLGIGFMLVETKAITELGLLFGNTWQVVGITIVCVLIMAFLANFLVSLMSFKSLSLAFILLLSVIAAGYMVATGNGAGSQGNFLLKAGMPILLTSPLFFSGIIFSTLLKKEGNIGSAMSYNLMGAMVGGLMEYNSMRYGFSSLYLIAFLFYALAWLSSKKRRAS